MIRKFTTREQEQIGIMPSKTKVSVLLGIT
jgi:hypothetical protein